MKKHFKKGNSEDKFNNSKNSVSDEPADNASLAEDTAGKGFFSRFGAQVSSGLKNARISDVAMCAAIAWIMVFVLEILGRHSVADAFVFMFKEIGFYFSNFAIVFATTTLCLFFKRRYFALSMVLFVWLGLGIANGIILSFRNTPLAWVDLSIVFMAFEIMNSYVKMYQVVLGTIGVLFVIAGIVLIARYAPKKKPNYVSAAAFWLMSIAVCAVSVLLTFNLYVNNEDFADLPEAYKNYGFAYCFSSSAINRGVAEPDDYNEEKVMAVVDKISSKKISKEPDIKPNIIYLQLESFFDVKYMEGVTYSEDPIPNFTKLKEENSSGYLRIPGLGGGTCNSEFEVLTGMSVGMFGTCEYPYNTITQEQPTGTVCYDLKNYGYTTHAIHNHTGTFYNRHINYQNLGFDTFTSVEFMSNVERNPNNWAKDKVIADSVLKCLKSTKGRDFVFAVSVQSHGNYPSEVIDPTQTIYVTSEMEDVAYKNGFEYYINQIHEMDMFVGELVETFRNYDEPVVLVLYGDHLPAINISKDSLVNKSLFETEYVIWANFDIPVNDEYLYAYQLNSRVTEMLGFDGNYINALHRYYKNDKANPGYRMQLQMLMYDQLYGNNYAYGGASPYKAVATKYGIDPITISRVEVNGTSTTIRGTGFTEKSVVFIDGSEMETQFISDKVLVVKDVLPEHEEEIYVSQMTSDNVSLHDTEVYIYKEAMDLQSP